MVQLFSQDKKDPKKIPRFFLSHLSRYPPADTVFSDVLSFNLAIDWSGSEGDTRALQCRRHLGIFLRPRVPLVAGRPFLAEEENARPQRAGRDRPLQLLGQSMTRPGDARFLTY